MSDRALSALVVSGLGYINLRGNANDEAFRKAVEAALGQPLPAAANTSSVGAHRVCWLGPDEWLVAASHETVVTTLDTLGPSLGKVTCAVNDLSGGYVTVRLTGTEVRHLLAKGCTLDLHPDVFKPGDCAQSGLGKASVLIDCVDDAPTIEVVVRRSFADYLVNWLQHAGRDHGIEFS